VDKQEHSVKCGVITPHLPHTWPTVGGVGWSLGPHPHTPHPTRRVKMTRISKPTKQHYAPSEGAMRRMQDALHHYDREVKAIELKWGVDRLPWLVDEALRGRFEAQMDRLNEAIDKMQDVEHQVSVTLRGVEAMVNAAIAAGHKPLTGEYWEAAMPQGQVLAITRNEYEAGKVKAENRSMMVYTISEIAVIIEQWQRDKAGQLSNAAKEMWPGATVERVSIAKKELIDDDIPF